MDTKQILEVTRDWIVKKRAASAKPGAERFELTSLMFCVEKATENSGLWPEELELTFSLLRISTSETGMSTHDVFSPEDALKVVERALQTFRSGGDMVRSKYAGLLREMGFYPQPSNHVSRVITQATAQLGKCGFSHLEGSRPSTSVWDETGQAWHLEGKKLDLSGRDEFFSIIDLANVEIEFSRPVHH